MNPEVLHLLLPLLVAYPDLVDHLSPYLSGDALGYLAAMLNTADGGPQ